VGGASTNPKGKKMIRNLKILGLALGAVFAMSAVLATAAMAQQGLLTSDGPVTLTGSETGTTNFLKAFGLTVECPGSTYVGHKVGTTEPIPSGSTEATLTPTYKVCKVTGLNWPATVTMNGCDYVAKLGNTTATPADTYGVTASLKCPAGKDVTLDIWTPDGSHAAGAAPMCIIHFGEAGNLNLAGGDLTDTTQGGTANDIDLTGAFKKVTATKTKSATDPLLCPEATTTEGELSVDVTVKGDSKAGAATGVSLSHL
jgi:hypothetical protein